MSNHVDNRYKQYNHHMGEILLNIGKFLELGLYILFYTIARNLGLSLDWGIILIETFLWFC